MKHNPALAAERKARREAKGQKIGTRMPAKASAGQYGALTKKSRTWLHRALKHGTSLRRVKWLRPRRKVLGLDRVGANRELMAMCEFKDKRSYWHIDGRLILEGKDWVRQKQRLATKYGNKCARCGRPLPKGWHAHHEVHRSSGRDDALENLIPYCGKRCHDLEHDEKNKLHWTPKERP